MVLFESKKKKKTFLVRRNDYYTWVIPGGGIEKGENPKQAALREAREETGFKVKIIKPLGIYQILDRKGKKLRRTYLFEGRVISGQFKPEFPGCLGRWFSVNRLPLNTSESVRTKIKDSKTWHGGKTFYKKRGSERFFQNFHLLLVNPIGAAKYFLKKR